jgi:predicted MFS family arabinose efflux permease
MSRPARGGASYRAVLSSSPARLLFCSAMLARLSYGMLPLPLLLALRAGTGSYATAGAVDGLFGLFTALLGPYRARMVARRPRTLVVLAVAYAALLAAVAVGCAAGPPGWFAAGCALAAGLVPPPVGPLARRAWGDLTGDEALRQTALGLDTAGESAVYALGPLVGGWLVAVASAPVALGACSLVVLAGFPVLARVLRGTSGAGSVEAAPDQPAERRPRPLRTPGFAAMLPLPFAVAVAQVLVEFGTVVRRPAAVAGTLLALVSVGGVLGGLAYGRARWRIGPARRAALLALVCAGCFTVAALVTSAVAVAPAFLLVGAGLDGLLLSCYLRADDLVAPEDRTEAGAWVNTAGNLGGAIGAAAAGLLVSDAGPRAAALVAVALPLVAVVAARSGWRSSGRRGGAGIVGPTARLDSEPGTEPGRPAGV